MSSIADNNVALETMRNSNEDVLELIMNLKGLLTSNEPITFNFSDSYSITVDGIQALIDNYRNGKFDSVTLGGQSSDGKQVVLSVTPEGNLRISDASGNLVGVVCSELRNSDIIDSTFKKITVQECEIESIKGTATISGGSCILNSIKINNAMQATSLNGDTINVGTLNITHDMSCKDLVCYGTRKLTVSKKRDLFRGSSIINDYYKLLNKTISKNVWDVTASSGSPKDLGFTTRSSSAPGMITVQGNNNYDDLLKFNPTNIKASISGKIYDIDTDYLEFPALISWPTGYIKESSNQLTLTNFKLSSDENNDIYYVTGGNPWFIYRTMAVYDDKVTFSNLFEIPPYSCMRFILGIRKDSASSISVLEIA